MKQTMKEVRDEANYRGVEIDEEYVRVLLNDEFAEMKRSAEEELYENQVILFYTLLYD